MTNTNLERTYSPESLARSNAVQSTHEPIKPAPTQPIILHLQRLIGNRTVGRLLLSKSQANDPGACEDLATKHVARASLSYSDVVASRSAIHQDLSILRRRAASEAPSVELEVESEINRSRGGGQALESNVRGQMESSFGAEFSDVRVHADAQADNLNRAVHARAFTTGKDIFFKQGEYSPGSSSGRELLAHELTHVVQQNGFEIQRKLALSQPGDEYEQEADKVAQAVVQREQWSIQKDIHKGKVRRQAAGEEEKDELVQTKVVNARIQSQSEVPAEEKEEKPTRANAVPIRSQSAVPQVDEQELVRQWTAQGQTNENLLTNQVYFHRHPEVDPQMRFEPGTPQAQEWALIRDTIVRQLIGQSPRAAKTAAHSAKARQPETTASPTESILENIHHAEQVPSGDKDTALTRFWNLMVVVNAKVMDFISAGSPGTKETTQTPVTSTTNAASQVTNDSAAQKSKAIKDVLQTAMGIEDGLREKYGKEKYAKGEWVTVKDDPEGIELDKLHHTQYSNKKGNKKDKNITYKVWKGGFYGYGEVYATVAGSKQKIKTDKYVCTTFVEEALRRAGYTIETKTRVQINIGNLDYKELSGKEKPTDEEKSAAIRKLIEKNDPRIKGMVTALVDTGQGSPIDVKEAKPGDLVQYWHGVEGHAVIVKKPKPQDDGSLNIVFHGSHKSRGGIGDLDIRVLEKGGEPRKGWTFYAVRPNGQ